MKTTHKKAIEAYRSITEIGRKTNKTTTSLKLFKLKKALYEAVEFISEEETKLAEMAGAHADEKGNIIIEDNNKREEFVTKQREAYQSEFDAPEKITLRVSELPDLSVNDIEALADFIDFTDD